MLAPANPIQQDRREVWIERQFILGILGLHEFHPPVDDRAEELKAELLKVDVRLLDGQSSTYAAEVMYLLSTSFKPLFGIHCLAEKEERTWSSSVSESPLNKLAYSGCIRVPV